MPISDYLKLVPSPVALVTGANKGIGWEIARQLSEGGIFVWVAGRDLKRATEAAAKLPTGKARAIRLDVTDLKSVAGAAEEVRGVSGRLDILVNNAGIANERKMNKENQPEIIPPSELDLSLMREIYDTNVFGVVSVIQAFLPLVRKSVAGRIVNMSSGLGSLTLRTDPQWPYAAYNSLAYCSSKTAVNGVTVAFAKELASTGIKVNAADPGYCATDLNGHSGPRSAKQGSDIAVYLATLPKDGPTSAYFNDDGAVPW